MTTLGLSSLRLPVFRPLGWLFTLLFAFTSQILASVINVNTAAQLTSAVNNGAAGDTINIAAGTYQLSATLTPKANMTINGAGMGSTILVPASTWNPGTTGLPDNATDHNSAVKTAYLFNLEANKGIKIRNLTADGAGRLHGAVYGNDCDNLELSRLHIRNFIWSGVRTWRMDNAVVERCEFEDAGGVHGGVTGGGLYLTWVKTSRFSHNWFHRSPGSTRNFYGIKAREARGSRFNHNTILVNFSMEFPHEHDYDNEIDHNYIWGVISLPKNGGGGYVPPSGITFHIHHNYFSSSYAIEGPRNGMEISHNLFDLTNSPAYGDGGNIISSWGDTAQGATKFHNNLIKDPGRGIFWSQNVYNNFSFYNNHVIANRTATPRTEGFFGFNTATTFSTIVIKDNIIECINQPRPLMRNTQSHAAVIQNNTLINVSDSGSYANANTGATRGPTAPLYFKCGADEEFLVNQWTITELNGLPAPWASADIGAVGAPGGASVSGSTFTVWGSGSDIWNSADEFHYVYRPVTGDVTVTARVTSLQNTDPWAKAGVMIRETLNANSRHASTLVTPSNGVSFQRRTITGSGSSHTTTGGIAAPHWVRITRSGDTFTSHRSADGVTWVQIGTPVTIAMSANVFVGLPMTSHVKSSLGTAVFDNVTVAQSGSAPAAGDGLVGQYYDNMDFTNLMLTRTDATVDFNWGSGAPHSSMGVDTFSVRWTGKVQPQYSGTYTFFTSTDDGVRLWVNNVLLIDRWVNQGTTEWSGTINLTAGQKYDIRMDYFENGGSAVARLSWSHASQPKQIIPQARLFTQ